MSRPPGATAGARHRGLRGAVLFEALVALAIAVGVAIAWLPVRQAAQQVTRAARDHAAAADAVRRAHEKVLASARGAVLLAADEPTPTGTDGPIVETRGQPVPGLPLTDLVHAATWTDAGGGAVRWTVAARVFTPDPALWAAQVAGPGPRRAALIGPGGLPPAWRDVGVATGDATTPLAPRDPSRPDPRTGRPMWPDAVDPARTCAGATAASSVRSRACPPTDRPAELPMHLSLLAGNLDVDPILLGSVASVAQILAWMAATPAAGDGGRCRVTASGQGWSAAAWWCVESHGRATDAPGAWLDRSLVPLTAGLPANLQLCRHVDADAPALDPSAPSWRLHLRLVPSSVGCPVDLRPVGDG
jgi:hypothetical protein